MLIESETTDNDLAGSFKGRKPMLRTSTKRAISEKKSMYFHQKGRLITDFMTCFQKIPFFVQACACGVIEGEKLFSRSKLVTFAIYFNPESVRDMK